MPKFQNRLKQLRIKRKLSRKALSELCGLSSDTVRRYESGEAAQSMHALIALADFFKVPLDYLCGRDRYASQLIGEACAEMIRYCPPDAGANCDNL